MWERALSKRSRWRGGDRKQWGVGRGGRRRAGPRSLGCPGASRKSCGRWQGRAAPSAPQLPGSWPSWPTPCTGHLGGTAVQAQAHPSCLWFPMASSHLGSLLGHVSGHFCSSPTPSAPFAMPRGGVEVTPSPRHVGGGSPLPRGLGPSSPWRPCFALVFEPGGLNHLGRELGLSQAAGVPGREESPPSESALASPGLWLHLHPPPPTQSPPLLVFGPGPGYLENSEEEETWETGSLPPLPRGEEAGP